MKRIIWLLLLILMVPAMFSYVAWFTPVSASTEAVPFLHEAASLVLLENWEGPPVFWLKVTPTRAGLDQIVAARRHAGSEIGRFNTVDYIMCRATVLPDRFEVNRQIYFDQTGDVIADWNEGNWESAEKPGGLIAGQAQNFLPEHFKIKKHNLPPGFVGIPWGSSPDAIPGALQDETLVEVLRIYTAEVDVSALIGEVKQVKKAWLVFAREQGLQRGVINFDGRQYRQVLQRLTDLLGNPKWERGNELYWQPADDLRIEIDVIPAFGMLHGTLHLRNPQFAEFERQAFKRPK